MHVSAIVRAGKSLLSDCINNELFIINLATVSAEGILKAPPAQSRKTFAPIFAQPPTMTEQEIIKSISKVDGLGGMTVNERLFVCGLMDEFDKALIEDKAKAKKILELLRVDKPSIEKIVK